MKTRRKFLSLLLTVVMVLTLLPTRALAGYEDGVDCEFCGSWRYDDWKCDNGDHCGAGADGSCYEEHHCPGCEGCLDEGTEKCGNCEVKCGNCATVCSECSNCEDCVEAFCESCEKCNGCAGRICPNCNNCAECGAMGVEFYCESCGNCAGCIDGNFCFACELCYECTQTCEAEGDGDHNHCEACVELCPECHTCSESWILPGVSCSDCGKCATCFDGAMCKDCEACGECVQLCAADGEDHAHCENCVELCEGCHVCSEGWILPGVKCEGCDLCAACFVGGLCTVCNNCEGCGPGNFCEASSGEDLHCADCADLCPECNTCAECSGADSLCPDCATCSQCSPMFCDGCQRCDACVTICNTCGEHCNECENLCQDCENCAVCNPLCQNCGEYCGECKTTCDGCNTCEDCAKVCGDCGNFCSECDTMCTTCEERCAQCTDTCDECGVCAECATICAECGKFCSDCSAECEHCGGLTDCQHHALCSVCNVCLRDPDHEVCGSCGSHLTDCYYKSLDETVHQCTCSCGEPLDEPAVHGMLYKVITAPTETATGVGQKYCGDCGYVEKKIVIPATGEGPHVHDYSIWVASEDSHVKYCPCGEKNPATQGDHVFAWVTTQEPTSTQAGLKHESCTVCGHNRPAVSIPPTGHTHSYASKWSKNEDQHWKECGCGEKTEVSAHSFGPWVITKAPTEILAGSKERACTVCAYKQVVVLPAIAGYLTVTFDAKGGSAVAGQSVKTGSTIVKPADPTWSGYIFMGWYEDPAYSSKWNFSNPIFEPKQLYAKWTKNLEGPPTIITDTLSDGIKGVSYEEALAATGSIPVSFSLESGSLPEGLTLSTAGKITGTPTKGGMFDFTVRASNGQNPDATKAFSIKVEVKHLVTVNDGTGGGYYSPGDTVTIHAGTKSGYTFMSWTSLDVVVTGAGSRNASFTMPDHGVTVTANWSYNGGGSTGGGFSDDSSGSGASTGSIDADFGFSYGYSYNYHTITASASEGGSISPSGELSIREGLGKTFAITADTGYVVDDVLVDGKSVGSVYSYTFENVDKGHTIKASFIKTGQTTSQVGADFPFADVQKNNWFYEPVKYVYEKGLMAGVSRTTFAPYLTTTRGMIVTILHSLEGRSAVSGANPFDDVEEGAWYSQAIKWAATNKIVAGYGNGKFGPNDNITREQMASILYRYAQHKGHDVSARADLSKFSDAGNISGYAKTAMEWVNAEGFVSGTGGGILDPRGKATRAQVATILHYFCEKFVK